MFKSILTFCIWIMVFLSGQSLIWSFENMDDRFINPDVSTAKNIFIDVKGVSLVDILKIISKQSGLSFIAAPDVGDIKLTLYLNKIPLNQALHEILDTYDLTYQMQEDSNVFIVMKKAITEKTLITKIYPLKYASVSSSKLNSTLSTGGGASASGSGGLEDAVKNALSTDGKIIEDPRTNSLIVTDIPAQFPFIESAINKLDVPIPEILIEVEMLDVQKGLTDSLGFTYGGGSGFTPITFTGGTKASNFPFGPGTSGGGSSSSSSSSGSSSGGTAGWDASGMSFALNLIASNTTTRVLATPRILTLNNMTAQIEISTDQAISVTNTTTAGSNGSGSVSGNTVERTTTGVVLKVTPQANMLTREITLALSPKIIDALKSPFSTSAQPVYDPTTRGSDSILRLKDGQTMVIGGLMRNELDSTVNKVPIFGDLPFLGWAFRSKQDNKEERELLIFLTPHIIDDGDTSALKGGGASSSVNAAVEAQNDSNRAQEVDNDLNNFENQ